MPTKQEVYDSIQETQTYRGSEVKHLIYSIKAEPDKHTISKVMVGDVFITGGLNSAKTRPSTVLKPKAMLINPFLNILQLCGTKFI